LPFEWGMSVIAMLKYKIKDLRLFTENIQVFEAVPDLDIAL